MENIQARNIDWENVEYKIAIILRKFNNIDPRYRDDLAQELRIHAYYVSDDYYDLHRRAIDFWRSLTRNVYPEIPFIDLELMVGLEKPDESKVYFQEIVSKIRRELSRGPYRNVSEEKLDKITNRILDIILEDFEEVHVEPQDKFFEIKLSKFHNGRINVSYLDERMPDVNYKMLIKAMKRLEEVVTGLSDMGMI